VPAKFGGAVVLFWLGLKSTTIFAGTQPPTLITCAFTGECGVKNSDIHREWLMELGIRRRLP
jgi:hypothetical protein